MTDVNGGISTSPYHQSDLAYQSKGDALAFRLRHSILQGVYNVGTYIRQNTVAEQYGVSPTPVREALRTLEAEGLIVHESNRGFRVVDWGGNVEEFCRLREAVELLAVELAVHRITPEVLGELEETLQGMRAGIEMDDPGLVSKSHRRFHEAICNACGFPALQEIIRTVWVRFPWDMLLSLSETRRISVEEHEVILRLIRSGDSQELIEKYREHIRSILRYISNKKAGTSGGTTA